VSNYNFIHTDTVLEWDWDADRPHIQPIPHILRKYKLVHTDLTVCEKSSTVDAIKKEQREAHTMAHTPSPSPKGLTLQEWLDASELSYSAFARSVPCSTSYPRLLAHGLARPSYEMATRIEELSGGLVPRTNWYPAGESPQSYQPFSDNLAEDLIHDARTSKYTDIKASFTVSVA